MSDPAEETSSSTEEPQPTEQVENDPEDGVAQSEPVEEQSNDAETDLDAQQEKTEEVREVDDEEGDADVVEEEGAEEPNREDTPQETADDTALENGADLPADEVLETEAIGESEEVSVEQEPSESQQLVEPEEGESTEPTMDGQQNDDEVIDAPQALQDATQEAHSNLDTVQMTENVSGLSADVVHSEPTIVEADEEELLHRIPEDFYYDYHELASKPIIAQDSEIPHSLLSLHHSFGYDCNRRANLHLLDDDHIIFSAGSLLVLLSIKLRKHTYIKAIGGGSIGAITVHPERKFFIVAEKGVKPHICVYEYPSLKLYRILRGGTEESYSFVTFDPTGEMLASLGGKPDYMLTIWNWRHEHITLRCKAFSQEIFRVSFSSDLEGILTTAGQGHIRFWKMARTFTGLKLQGEIGRFGKTELSDIEGYVELPDGKVLSGCESGNMLLWDGGLIKVQIGRKRGKPCHVGPIQQFIMDEGELLTVGVDGYIRVWDFESIDQAEAPDEGSVFEMDAMNELLVEQKGSGSPAMLRWMIKAVDSEDDSLWYAQDGDGGIWKLDLSFSHTTKPPEQLFSFHAGTINGVEVSPVTDLAITAGTDRTIRVYDYITKHQLCVRKYPAAGTCVKWLPTTVDSKGSTVIAGFGDGVLRVLKVSKRELDLSRDLSGSKSLMGSAHLTLTQVLKPHNSSITALEFNSDYTYLASGSSDKTIFFFSMDEYFKLVPIGYIIISCSVQQLQFAPHLKERRLLVVGDNGRVVDLVAPEAGSVDISKTYEIKDVSTRQFQFKSVKDHLRREERRRIREEERRLRREKKAKDRQKKIERGLIDPEKEPEEPESDEEPDPDEGVPLFIPESYHINTGFYSREGHKFWLSMSGFDAGFLYQCDFAESEEQANTESYGEPTQIVELPGMDETPISFISQCSNNMYIFGLENGSIRIQVLAEPFKQGDPLSFGDLSKYWMLPMHDIDLGSISIMTSSASGKFLLSAGRDGNLFVFTFLSAEELEEAMAPARLPSPRALVDEQASKLEDIKDPKAYSLEDAKQKAERDKLLRLAEEKKAGLKKKIQEMRRQFKKLLLKNGEIAQHLQLHRNEFELDPQSKIMLSNETLSRMDFAKTEYAWDSEKQSLALSKLETRFKSKVDCDSLFVKCIGSEHEVGSFRCEQLPDNFEQKRLDLVSKASKGGGVTGGMRGGAAANQGAAGQDGSGESELQKDEEGTAMHTTTKPGTDDKSGKVDDRAAKALGKMEKQRQKRSAREKQWEDLYKEKPSDDFEDPRDVAEIKYALENMGDFKLKTAANYVVPEHLRMNTARKLVQLLTLQEKMFRYKHNFNDRLLSLKFKKSGVLSEIDQLNAQLDQIHSSLQDLQNLKRAPLRPNLSECEKPEELYHYSRDKLIRFQRDQAAHDKTMAMAVASAFTGKLEGEETTTDGVSQSKPSSATTNVLGDGTGYKRPAVAPDTNLIPRLVLKDQLETEEEDENEEEMIEREQSYSAIRQRRLLNEQESILARIGCLTGSFDDQVMQLRSEKFRIQVDLKRADLRNSTLFEEFIKLKEFEKRENILAGKVNDKYDEKVDMEEKVGECRGRVESKRVEIEKLEERQKSLLEEFKANLGDNNKWEEFLTKVFKKKIKRAKKKEKTGEEDEDDEESDSDDDDSDESDFDDEDEEGREVLDDSICPPGCEQELYDMSCRLRETRLDIEELLAEEKKNFEMMKKDADGMVKKTKVIQHSLAAAEKDLEDFQVEKQGKLNQLQIIVILKMHQIEYLICNVLPNDLSEALVFEQKGLLRLQKRILELNDETLQQNRNQKENKLQNVQLKKGRKMLSSKIQELSTECDQMMLLKFGRTVDLQRLEMVTVNRLLEELKEKYRQTELFCDREIAQWERSIQQHKENITMLTRDNTRRINQMTVLLGGQNSIEDTLNSKQKKLGGEYEGKRKADMRERERLIQLVQLQSQEIEALKEEITLLSRKGGHILPPAQPPMPVNQN